MCTVFQENPFGRINWSKLDFYPKTNMYKNKLNKAYKNRWH